MGLHAHTNTYIHTHTCLIQTPQSVDNFLTEFRIRNSFKKSIHFLPLSAPLRCFYCSATASASSSCSSSSSCLLPSMLLGLLFTNFLIAINIAKTKTANINLHSTNNTSNNSNNNALRKSHTHTHTGSANFLLTADNDLPLLVRAKFEGQRAGRICKSSALVGKCAC